MLLLLSSCSGATASILYVNLNSPTPESPYTNWLTAATNIQDAVDAAAVGDLILVTNGVYSAGGYVYGMTNRVAVTKPVTVQSVNGPDVTSIVGYQVPRFSIGAAAVRCVYLTNGAALAGFTVTNGATTTSASSSGGGVYCESASAVVSNCIIAGNSASSYGGGVYSGTLYNCTLSANRGMGGGACASILNNCMLMGNGGGDGGGANNCTLNNCVLSGNTAWGASGGSGDRGGGAYNSTLRNCTVAGNAAYFYNLPGGTVGPGQGGGVYGGTLYNCIVYYNPSGGNYVGGSFNYCCTTPLPGGTGNTNAAPQLASFSHLSAGSPCRGAGSATYASGLDIDGEPWASPPSIGCDEYWSGSVTGALSAAIIASYTNVPVGASADFRASIGGRLSASAWDFGDGTVLSNMPYASHAWSTAGDYAVTLTAYNESYPAGVTVGTNIHVILQHYVAATNPAPAWPYGSWATAATNIQDAVDAAATGATILVSNGVYSAGGGSVISTSNRVCITKPLALRSVNGPDVTTIRGSLGGQSYVRCVYLTNAASLSGFTIVNGYVISGSGGGVYCSSANEVVTNCVINGNSSPSGGGVYRGTLYNCTLKRNSATSGAGAYESTLNGCLLISNTASQYGGGADYATLSNCTLKANSATYGGGADSSLLLNCLVNSNSASSWGGGVYNSDLYNCVVTANTAPYGGGAFDCGLTNCTVVANSATVSSGGASICAVVNTIVYYNTAPYANYLGGVFDHACTTPLPPGIGTNITSPPLIVDLSGSDLRLLSNSPCINAGFNAFVRAATDLEGNSRITAGTVDIGAYECQSPALLDFYAWMAGYGLPTAASAIYADSDNDHMNNWQEWVAGTVPTNAASVLVLATPDVGADSVTLTWQSVTDRTYYVERAMALVGQGAFSVLETNIAGLAGSTSYTDTNAPMGAPAYYRVGAAW